jgi:hypothetical protein
VWSRDGWAALEKVGYPDTTRRPIMRFRIFGYRPIADVLIDLIPAVWGFAVLFMVLWGLAAQLGLVTIPHIYSSGPDLGESCVADMYGSC